MIFNCKKTVFLLVFLLTIPTSFIFGAGKNINSNQSDVRITVELEEGDYFAGGEVEGTVVISNNETHSVSDLRTNYILNFLPPEIDKNLFTSAQTKAFDISFGQNTFSLRGGEVKKIPLNYKIPSQVPQGWYQLKIALIKDGVSEESYINVNLGNMEGKGSYIDIKSVSILKNGEEYPSLSGVSYETDEERICKVEVQNKSTKEVALSPRLVSYLRFIGGKNVGEVVLKTVSLGPDETRTFNFKLPLIDDPQSYISTIQFNGSQNITSPIVACRFIVRGSSASISLFELDKNIYKSGDKAIAHVFATGPADLTAAERDHQVTTLPRIDLRIVINDFETGVLLGEISQEIDLQNKIDLNVEILIIGDSEHYKSTLTLSTKDGKLLASEEIENQPVLTKSSNDLFKYGGTTLVFVILALLIGMFSVRHKKEEVVANDSNNINNNGQ